MANTTTAPRDTTGTVTVKSFRASAPRRGIRNHPAITAPEMPVRMFVVRASFPAGVHVVRLNPHPIDPPSIANMTKFMNELLVRMPLQRSSPAARLVHQQCVFLTVDVGALAHTGHQALAGRRLWPFRLCSPPHRACRDAQASCQAGSRTRAARWPRPARAASFISRAACRSVATPGGAWRPSSDRSA
jgi:hypothetical protein